MRQTEHNTHITDMCGRKNTDHNSDTDHNRSVYTDHNSEQIIILRSGDFCSNTYHINSHFVVTHTVIIHIP